MDDKIIKKTQDTLGKIIKKPPLTEKLLKKPPFRFLHDIITSVIKVTGFMNGLFEDKDLNSENVKEKDSKIAFLQKAIDLVVLVTGKSLAVRPTKVVAGQEPEKTNEFLQALAASINKNVDNDEYVQRLLNGEKPGSSKPSSASKSKDSREKSRDKNKERDSSADKRRKESSRKSSGNEDKRTSSGKEDKRPSSKDSDRGENKDRKDSGRKDERNRRDRDEDKENEKDRDRRDTSRRKREKDDRGSENRKNEERKEDTALEDKMVNGETESHNDDGDDHPVRISRPTSAKGPRRRHRDEEEEVERIRAEQEKQRRDEPEVNGSIGEDDLPPQVMAARRMARPGSARPAAPRIKKQEQVQEDPLARLGSGKQAANVIVDGNHSDDDDFVVEESGTAHVEIERESTPPETEDDGEHGGLVKKILESKKELEGGSQTAQAKSKKQEPEKPFYNDAARRKEREMVQREIEKLRNSIQTLTRSANPLGKIMDYVQEDLDSMQKELEMWKKENKEHSLALKREQSVTDSSIEPLKAQLSELDQAIVDQIDQIAAVKSNMTRNDEKIDKMLHSITKS